MGSRLFQDLVVSDGQAPRRGGLAFQASAALHAALLSAAIAIPLLTPNGWPETASPDPAPAPLLPIVVPALVSGRPPAPPRPGRGTTARPGLALSPRPAQMPIPRDEPDTLPGPDALGDAAPGCLVGCGPVGTVIGSADSNPSQIAPPVTAIRLARGVRAPAKLRHVDPVYPEVARRAHVQGVVELECTIGPDGRVAQLRVVSGPPLLGAAALEAVRQWVYTPTLLNGVPVPVVLTVTVRFQLG